MRSVSQALEPAQPVYSVALTAAENTFRNPKLQVAYKAFSDVAAKGSLFLVTLVAARRLETNAFGAYALGSTCGWMLAVASDFGMQVNLARAVARAPEHGSTLLARWAPLRVASTALLLTVLALGLLLPGVPDGLALPIFLFALGYAFTGLVEFTNYFFRGLSRSDVESSIALWHRAGTLVFGVTALVWRPNVTVFAVALLIPPAGALIWSAFRTRTLARQWTRPMMAASGIAMSPVATITGTITATASASLISTFRRDVVPIGIGGVLSALYFRIDVFLVQLWAGIEAVARYNAVFRLIDALRLFPAAVMAVVLPTLCRATTLRPLVQVSAIVTAFAIAVAAALWVGAGWLIPFLYGNQYLSAVNAFRILALTFPLLSLNLALTHQLIAQDAQQVYAWLSAVALPLNIGLNAWLIPAASIDGAAWATAGTEAFLTIGCVVALARRR